MPAGDEIDARPRPPRTDALEDLLPIVPHARPPGALLMLRLIAYDIAEPRRWRRVHEACADYGVAVQYSLFECWLEDAAFEALWANLQTLIDPAADRLISYVLDASAARQRRHAGDAMQCTQKPNWYLV